VAAALPLFRLGPIEPNTGQRLIHLVQRFLAKVRDAKQVISRAIQEIVHCEHAAFFQTIGRSY
jgi:hypothetical protein